MTRKQKTTNKLLTTTPLPSSDQKIARVLSSRGKNLFEITAEISQFGLGSFVIISPSSPDRASKNKIGGEIVHVLLPEHIKQLKLENIWPKKFDSIDTQALTDNNNNILEEEDDNDDLFVNTNRIAGTDDDSSESGDDDDSSESEEEDHDNGIKK
ncbi:3134_t:CDS:2 [Ambispora gerdemannii]|uniref:3134_t:CDS:1 n=1 Tax=Ambispora gerdemannii TaxID=144530 RepID=A0A9N9F9G2_9GLOM|nr:3134_t:CDS:2 [Ambispora gerdemannii]